MAQEPNDVNPPPRGPLRTDPNPFANLHEPPERPNGARITRLGGAGAPGVYVGGGIEPVRKVTFRWRLNGDIQYPAAAGYATGNPRFLDNGVCREGNHYLQFRIGGERPMGLVVLMDGNNVYTGIIHTEMCCMKIYFRRRYLPSRFTIQLWTITGDNQGLQDEVVVHRGA